MVAMNYRLSYHAIARWHAAGFTLALHGMDGVVKVSRDEAGSVTGVRIGKRKGGGKSTRAHLSDWIVQ